MTQRLAQSKKLLLIDGNSLFHRAYHALPPLTDKSGEMANAVFGFSNMLIKAINEVGPTYVACAFDTAAPTFRHIEFEKYKAQRPTPPPDLYPQLPKVKKVLDAFGIPYFEKEGYEADDLLATLASRLQTPNSKLQTIILSGDRDCLQLINGNIKVQMPSFAKATEGKPGWGILMGAHEVKEKYGLEPNQMVDYKSLIGDQSDNVPGITGIGPKTAASLLQKYHTLENLFKHVKESPLKVQEKLEAGKDVALAAKRLVELDRNVDIEFRVKSLEFRPDWDRVTAEYEDLGFKSIVTKLPGSANTSEVGSPRRFTLKGSDFSEVGKRKNQIANREQRTKNQDQLKLV